jgi:hypothetical protein
MTTHRLIPMTLSVLLCAPLTLTAASPSTVGTRAIDIDPASTPRHADAAAPRPRDTRQALDLVLADTPAHAPLAKQKRQGGGNGNGSGSGQRGRKRKGGGGT